MLDFYLIDPHLTEPYYDWKGIRVGGLTLEDVQWLHQYSIVKGFSKNQYNSSEVEALPFFHDFQLSLEMIKRMDHRYKKQIQSLNELELENKSMLQFKTILEAALEAEIGLQAICD
ncbi:MAG: hypothetical protein AAF614_00180 [Chloroflexota bacterium]